MDFLISKRASLKWFLKWDWDTEKTIVIGQFFKAVKWGWTKQAEIQNREIKKRERERVTGNKFDIKLKMILNLSDGTEVVFWFFCFSLSKYLPFSLPPRAFKFCFSESKFQSRYLFYIYFHFYYPFLYIPLFILNPGFNLFWSSGI